MCVGGEVGLPSSPLKSLLANKHERRQIFENEHVPQIDAHLITAFTGAQVVSCRQIVTLQ